MAKNKKKLENRSDGSPTNNPEIAEWFVLKRVEQLSAIASAKRQKILAEFIDQAKTTKQVAEILGEPPTRLYHHVDALVEQGILVLERQQQKRGTMEKYYRAAAKQFRVDESCLSNKGFRDENSRVLSEMLDDVRLKMSSSLAEAAMGNELHTTIAGSFVKTDDAGIEKLSSKLISQLKELCEHQSAKQKKSDGDVRSYRIMLLIYPDDD